MQKNENNRTILICQGTGCVSTESPAIQAAQEEAIGQLGLSGIQVKLTGCHGFCQQGPIVIVEPDGIFYSGVELEDVHDIVQSHLPKKSPVVSVCPAGWAQNRCLIS